MTPTTVERCCERSTIDQQFEGSRVLSEELRLAAADIRSNPKFANALRAFAASYAEALAGNPSLSKIAMEEARLLLCGHMIAMHHRRGSKASERGIVLSRVQAFGSKHGIAGRNRIGALVALMKHAGYLRAAKRNDGDGRTIFLDPTLEARRAVRKFVLPFLKALDVLQGGNTLQAQLRADMRFQDAIIAHLMDLYFNGGAIFDAAPDMRLFSERDAGYEILLGLWAKLDPERPKAGQVVSLPYRGTAALYGISRAHVRRLIEAAARRQYFCLRAWGGRAIEVRPAAVELVETFVSMHLGLYRCAADRAIAETRQHVRRSRHSPKTGWAAPAQAPALVLSKHPRDYVFCLSVPFKGQDSFRHIIAGYQEAVSMLGGTMTIAEAKWDTAAQAEQIASFVGSKPDALFVVPTDPGAICSSIRAACDARVPTFLCDSNVAGAAAQSVSIHNNFGMGVVTAEYICRRLKGKGNIAVVSLPSNEAWDMRTQGMRFVLARYPDIKVTADWAFSLTDSVSPREAVGSMLEKHDNIDAIWNAWDGAAIGAAQSIRAAGRDNIFATGIDGGQEAFEYIKGGSAFCFTAAQSFYEEAYWNVHFAHEVLAGRQVPRTIVNPAYAVTKDMLSGTIPDNYDRPGVAEKLGWQRVL